MSRAETLNSRAKDGLRKGKPWQDPKRNTPPQRGINIVYSSPPSVEEQVETILKQIHTQKLISNKALPDGSAVYPNRAFGPGTEDIEISRATQSKIPTELTTISSPSEPTFLGRTLNKVKNNLGKVVRSIKNPTVQKGALTATGLAVAVSAAACDSKPDLPNDTPNNTATPTLSEKPIETPTPTSTVRPTHTPWPIGGVENFDFIRDTKAREIAEKLAALNDKKQRGETIKPSDLIPEADIDYFNRIMENLEKNKAAYATMTARAKPPVSPTNGPKPSSTPKPDATPQSYSPTPIKTEATKVPNTEVVWKEILSGPNIKIYYGGSRYSMSFSSIADIIEMAKTGAPNNDIEIRLLDPNQADKVPYDPNAKYDQNISWPTYMASSGAPLGRQSRIIEGKKYVHTITLPFVNTSNPNPTYGDQTENKFKEVSLWMTASLADEVCGLGDWKKSSNQCPATKAFAEKYLKTPNAQVRFANKTSLNLDKLNEKPNINYSLLALAQLDKMNGPKGYYGRPTG